VRLTRASPKNCTTWPPERSLTASKPNEEARLAEVSRWCKHPSLLLTTATGKPAAANRCSGSVALGSVRDHSGVPVRVELVDAAPDSATVLSA
jgi:hypothetical protein